MTQRKRSEYELGTTGTKWDRYILVGALLSGIVGGATTLVQDVRYRYTEADAARDFATNRVDREKELAVRDRDIGYAQESIRELRDRVERTEHPPQYVKDIIADHERRVRALEKALEKAKKGV